MHADFRPRILPPHVVHIAVDHQLSPVNQRHAIAQGFDLVHLVCRQDGRAAVSPPFEEQLLHQPHVYRVEPGGRLVEHAQLRVALERRSDLDLLRHSLAEALDFPAANLRELDTRQPLAGAPAGVGATQAFERAEVGHDVDDRQLRVQAAFLRQVAEAIQVIAVTRFAEHAHLTGVGPDDIHQDPDEGALAGAVGPEQPEDLARPHVERHATERQRLAVRLDDVIEREDDHAREAYWSRGGRRNYAGDTAPLPWPTVRSQTRGGRCGTRT
jgi:hypothetical protein